MAFWDIVNSDVCMQVAIQLMTGLEDALKLCLRHSGPAYGTASLPSMQRATVRQAALRVGILHNKIPPDPHRIRPLLSDENACYCFGIVG